MQNIPMTVFTEQELNLMKTYIETYSSQDSNKPKIMEAPIDKVLEPWSFNKFGLFEKFGSRLRFSKPIDIPIHYGEFRDAFIKNEAISKFRSVLSNTIRAYAFDYIEEHFGREAAFGSKEKQEYLDVYFFPYAVEEGKWCSDQELKEAKGSRALEAKLWYDTNIETINILMDPDCFTFQEIKPTDQQKNIEKAFAKYVYGKTAVKGDKSVQFQSSLKPMKTLCKCAEMYEIDKNIIEAARLAHSQILNKMKTKGRLTVSIHPLDFMTLSMNDNNWSSCMAWALNGCYSLGTVEMMNSPRVAVAYVSSSSDDWEFAPGCKWNSKRWRNLFIIDNEYSFIRSVKAYPYQNSDLDAEIIRFILDNLQGEYNLLSENINTTSAPSHSAEFPFYHKNKHKITDFGCYVMYNDIMHNDGCIHYTYVQDQALVVEDAKEAIYVYGTPDINCMLCGEMVDNWNGWDESGYYEDDGPWDMYASWRDRTPPRYVVCRDCLEGKICHWCNSEIGNNEDYTITHYDATGRCHEQELRVCQHCIDTYGNFYDPVLGETIYHNNYSNSPMDGSAFWLQVEKGQNKFVEISECTFVNLKYENSLVFGVSPFRSWHNRMLYINESNIEYMQPIIERSQDSFWTAEDIVQAAEDFQSSSCNASFIQDLKCYIDDGSEMPLVKDFEEKQRLHFEAMEKAVIERAKERLDTSKKWFVINNECIISPLEDIVDDDLPF